MNQNILNNMVLNRHLNKVYKSDKNFSTKKLTKRKYMKNPKNSKIMEKSF
jgi:hypothetical protein